MNNLPNPYEPLEAYGQIQKGDELEITFEETRDLYKVVRVINSGRKDEEILLNHKNNLYFITSMALEGTSWAKDVMICIDK
jgi:hypothetical protein